MGMMTEKDYFSDFTGEDFTVNPLIDRIIYLNGCENSFKCDCGCNVFREIEWRKFSCNSCYALWIGE